MGEKMPPREYFDLIRKARDGSALINAREKYIAKCENLPLGQQVEVIALEDSTGFVLRAKTKIDRGRPITGFAADAVVMPCNSTEGAKKTPLELLFNGSLGFGKPQWVRASGPFAVACGARSDNALFANAMAFSSAPVVGFPPITAVISDPEINPKPDLAGIWVAGVVDGNPFEALKVEDEALPTWAQITVSYLALVRARSNVRVAVEKGMPPVVLALRDIDPGEILKTGRPPAFWMDEEFAQRVIDTIMTHQSCEEGRKELGIQAAGMTRDDLCAMVFG